MNRGPYKFHCCCSRLNEFFDWYEIDWYIANIEHNNLNPHGAIQWLDAQVRTNYVTGVDTDPAIESRLLEYLVNHGELEL